MSNVIAVFKIYPKEEMLDKALEQVKGMGPQDVRTEDLAFGIKIIRAAFKFNDEESGSSKIEERLKGLDSVGEVEVEEETLL
jgi:translation elongation factor EF-1beta